MHNLRQQKWQAIALVQQQNFANEGRLKIMKPQRMNNQQKNLLAPSISSLDGAMFDTFCSRGVLERASPRRLSSLPGILLSTPQKSRQKRHHC